MKNATNHTIVGFFPTRERAETAVDELLREGFSRDDISIVAGQGGRPVTGSTAGSTSGSSPVVDAPKIGPITETGSTADTGEKAAIGSMAGFIAGIVALAIPGIGPIIAAGPLAVALTGAAAGAAAGGLIGVMTNDGVPEEAARRYSTAIGAGNVMVTVRVATAKADLAADVLDRSGAIQLDESAQPVGAAKTVGTVTPEGVRAAKLDDSSSLVKRQKDRERRIDVYPGITGGNTQV